VTRRSLYFTVLWLPSLIPVIGVGVLIHAPFAAFYSLRASGISTERLLAHSWRVPFYVAAWALVATTLFSCYAGVFGRLGGARRELAALADFDYWTSLIIYTEISFAAAWLYVGLGWLLLLTIGRRWPLDASR
jgi:hypothetical protein